MEDKTIMVKCIDNETSHLELNKEYICRYNNGDYCEIEINGKIIEYRKNRFEEVKEKKPKLCRGTTRTCTG